MPMQGFYKPDPLSTDVEPSTQGNVTPQLKLHSFNPNNVTRYNLNLQTGDLIVAFTSGEVIRYVGPRAAYIFQLIREWHWHTEENFHALDSLNALEQSVNGDDI